MMKKNLSALLKTLYITLGLHALLTVAISFLTRTVHREWGQALLFLAVTLISVGAVCIFATVPANTQGLLWRCFGLASVLGAVLSAISMAFYRRSLSLRWPGEGNLAWLLFWLLILTAWIVGVLAVTVFRSCRVARESLESNRQVRHMRRGYRMEVSLAFKGQMRLYAAVKGFLWVVWYHTLTALLLFLLLGIGVGNTMISYVSFPVLWCLMAALCGAIDYPCRGAFALSAAVSNLLFFVLSSYFCMVIHIDPHKYRPILHLDSILTEPFENPEQMLAIAIFFSVWIAMAVFAAGHRRKDTEQIDHS